MANRMAGGQINKAKSRRISKNNRKRERFLRRYGMTGPEWRVFKKECRAVGEGYKIAEKMRNAYSKAFAA